jgi:hypothetical protein
MFSLVNSIQAATLSYGHSLLSSDHRPLSYAITFLAKSVIQ